MLLFLEQCLNGLQFGLLLFLLAAGLTLVFGIMDMVNLAHGSLYMVVAYFAATFVALTDSFVLGALLALGASILVGMAVEVVAIRSLYGRDHLDHVLGTFGLILFFNEAVRIVWGPAGLTLRLPDWLSTSVRVLPGLDYPTYRIAIIVTALAVALFLYVLVMRTRIGMLIRAGASNREMTGALGVNINLLYTLVFGLGAALAALAGLMQAPIQPVPIGLGENSLRLAFLMTLFTRIVILAIAATSLNLILGYGGMVSFGHAVYLGVGGYAVGILAYEGVVSGFAQWPVAIVASALLALLVGALSLRTRGVYFIMITLAFAQLVYYFGVGLDRYGADDGLTVYQRSQFADLINLSNRTVFYYLCLLLLVGTIYLVWRLTNSRFGLVVQGSRSNDRRMHAIGFPTYRYRLTCFVIAGAICGLAGALLANHTGFISPATMHWTRSGDLIVMVVLGGMASSFGPLIGAVTLLVLEELLPVLIRLLASGFVEPSVAVRVSEYWQVVLGPLFLLVVLFSRGGINGHLAGMRRG